MPSSDNTHSKIIRDAASTFLSPLGLTQKGRSRTWVDDQAWRLCLVEFQPSGFSRGTYLNVGCMWLWREKNNPSFDEGYRVEDFFPFENAEQFREVATKLAARAAAEVERYRSKFQTVLHVSDHYLNRNPVEFWPSFNAAVACGISGRPLDARRFFAHMLALSDDRGWVKSAQTEAANLNSIVHDTKLFRQTVLDTVIRTRKMLRLPEDRLVCF